MIYEHDRDCALPLTPTTGIILVPTQARYFESNLIKHICQVLHIRKTRASSIHIYKVDRVFDSKSVCEMHQAVELGYIME